MMFQYTYTMDWTTVLVLTIGLTYSQGSVDQAYTPNREYVYAYEAQLASGMPEGSKLYSGLKVRTDIRFQFKTASRVTMKMENIHLYKLNDIVDGEDPTREQLTVYKDLTGPEAKWMEEYLMKPISFKYIRGHITEIQSETDDYHWSLNVKRGALSMLEMNLEERRSIDSSDRQSKHTYSPTEFYTVMEPGVVGDCETSYRLERDMTQKDYMYLTKVRNYKNCLERPMYFRSVLNAMRCAQCEKDRTEPFKSGSQIRYYMKGDKSRFIIYSAVAESQHVFTPYSNEGGHVTTYINQTFVLVNQDSIKNALSGPRNPKPLQKGLQAEQQNRKDKPWKPLTHQQPLFRDPSPERSDEDTKQVITEILGMVYDNTKDDVVKQRSTSLSFALLDQLRIATPSVLRAVWEQFDIKENPGVNNDDRIKYYKRKIFIDLLPMTGTPAAFEVFSEYIRNNKLTPYEAAMALNSFTVTAYPDINIAKYLLELVRDNYVMNTEPVRQSAYLCLGAIADRIRHEKDRVLKELEDKEKLIKVIQAREHRRPVHDKLKSKLVDVRDKQEQTTSVFSTLKDEILKEVRMLFTSQKPDDYILAFKTIGNTGFPDFLSDCKSVIEDGSKPQTIRAQAVYSLRKMSMYTPEDVRTVLWPYYFNYEEQEEVRIASYLMIISTNPPRPMLEQISQSLFQEYNPNVGSFVYSHLEQLSNSTHPCLMSWAKNATFALRFARQFTPSFKYSRFFHLSRYYDDWKMGGAFEFGYVTSPEEFFPRSGAVHGNMYIMGYSTNFMEIGFNTEGLHKLASRLVGPGSKLAKGMSVLDILKNAKGRSQDEDKHLSDQESQSQSDIVKDIHDKLKVDPRRSSDPYGHIYFKLFNNEIRYFEFDESIIKNVIEKGQVELLSKKNVKEGQDVYFYTSTMFLQEYYSWFTEIGFPITFKFKGSTTNKLSGSWNFEEKSPRNVYEAKFDIKPSMAFELRGIMETDFYYFKSGFGVLSKIQSGSPLSFTVSADTQSGTFSTKFDFSNLNKNFLKSEMRPTFYVERHFMDITKERSTDLKYLDMMDGGSATPVSFEYGNKEFGLEFAVKGQMAHRDFYNQLPYYPFYGKNTLYFTVVPGTNPPQSGEFLFQYHYPEESSSDVKVGINENLQYNERKKSQKGLLSGLWSYLSGDSEGSSDASSQQRQRASLRVDSSSVKEEKKSKSTSPRNKFTFKFTGVGCSPERWFQFEGFYLKKAENNFDFNFHYMRTPFPEIETSPYNVEMKGTFFYPYMDISPSSLFDLAYQRDIQKLIKLFPRQDGEKESIQQELALQSRRSRQKEIYRLLDHKQTNKNINRLIEQLVQEVESRPDASIQELIKVVRQQKKSSKQVLKILKQSSRPLDASRKLQRIKDLIDQFSVVSDSIIKKSDVKDLREDILIKALVLRQQINKQRIEKVAKYLRGSLNKSQKEEIAASIERVKEEVKALLQHQSEIRQSSPESKPEQIQELRLQQSNVLKKLASSPSSLSLSDIEQLIGKSEEMLKSSCKLSKEPQEIAETVLSAIIQNQQIVKRLQQSVDARPIEKEEPSDSKHGEIRKLIQKLKEQSRAVALVVQVKKDEMEIKSLPDKDQQSTAETLKKLSKLGLEQLYIAISIPDSEAMKKDRAVEMLRDIVALNQKIAEEAEKIRKYSPLLLKVKSLAEKQDALLQRLEKSVRSDSLLREQVQNAIVSNLGITSRLLKQVKETLKRKSAEGKTDINDLVSEIRQHLRSIEIHEQEQKEGGERHIKPVIDISTQTLKKIKSVVRSVSEQPRPSEYVEQLQQLKNFVVKQDETLQRLKSRQIKPSTLERELIAIVDNQRVELKQIRTEVDEIKDKATKERPRVEQAVLSSSELKGDNSMNFHMDVTFGYKELRSKMFYIQMVGKKSMEQLQWEARQISPNKDELVERYLQDRDDPSSKSRQAFRELKHELNFYRHYHFKIKYQKDDFEPFYRMMFWRFQEFFKYYWYPHAEFEMPREQTDLFDIVFDMRRNNRQMDIAVSTPLEWYKFYGLYFPWMYYFNFFYGVDRMQLPSSISESSLRLPLQGKLQGECELRERSIRTFDGNVLDLPEHKACDVIVAMDCSPSGRFLVKVKSIQESPQRKRIISLVVENRQIEVIDDVNPIVKIDGVSQELKADQPVVVRRSKAESSEKQSLAEISKHVKVVVINVPSESLQIVSSSEKVQIVATPIHTSRLCGLCGNYDGLKHNDMENAGKLKHKSVSCLLADYIRPSPQCNDKPIRDQCEKEQPKSPEDCRPQERTYIRSRISKNKSQLCFSVQPVKKCMPGCKEVRPKGKRVPMKCINQEDHRAKVLQSKSHHRSLHEIASLAVSEDDRIQSYIQEPYSCYNP